MQETIKINRDLAVVQVPFGTGAILPEGTEVTITQSLGSSFTVLANGSMYRVDDKDADALGKTQADHNYIGSSGSPEERVWSALRACYDPEIPVNIVDLGLVYGVDLIQDLDKFNAKIRMTLTSPGCGMGPIIIEDAKNRVQALAGINSVEIELVFDPPWDRSMISEQGKLDLGLL